MKKQEGWEIRLDSFIEERRNEPFAWGLNDCALFAADAVEVMTGVDPAETFRGYENEDEAYESVDGNLLAEVAKLAKANNWHSTQPSFAQRGDLLVYLTDEGAMLAISVGASAVSPGANGLVFRSCGDAARAYRIPIETN